MIIEDEQEIIERLESPDNLANRLEIRRLHNQGSTGRARINENGEKVGVKEIPAMIREIAVETAIEGGETPASVAKTFGVGASTVANGTRGLINTRLDKDLKQVADNAKKARGERIEAKKGHAHESALDSLIDSLGIVKQELDESKQEGGKLSVKKVKSLTQIASNLATIGTRLQPESEATNPNNARIVIYAPKQKQVNNYQVVQLGESV